MLLFEQKCAQLKKRYITNNRLLLVQIPQFHISAFDRNIAKRGGYYSFPPTGLQYLYEAIKNRGLDIEIIDLNHEILKLVASNENFHPQQWGELLLQKIQSFKPAMIGVSCLYDTSLPVFHEALTIARKADDALVICGGVAPAYKAKQILNDDLAHFVVEGEGENKLNYLLDNITDQSTATAATPGIYFHNGKESQQTQGAIDIVDISYNLIDSYKLVKIESYYKYGSLNPFSRRGDENRPFSVIQMSRGCRAQCTFCAVRDIMGKGIRYRSVADTLAEITFLYKEKGIRHFEWLDDDLLFRRREFQELLQQIIIRKWDITWSANNGIIATSIDKDTLQLMNDSGCIGFKVGIETGNPEMFRKIKKPGNFANFIKLSNNLKTFPRIFVGGNIMVGFPQESYLAMMDSFRFAMEVRLDWIAFTICQTIQGATAFSEQGEMFSDSWAKETVGNFIPTRSSASGQLNIDNNIATGMKVFYLPTDMIPDEEQVKDIWFSFNLTVNFIYNKNLEAGGQPEKFISWVEAARKAYPKNPYMLLFLSLANILLGNYDVALKQHSEAVTNSKNEYWQRRLREFYLTDILHYPPSNGDGVYLAIENIRTKVYPHIRGWLEKEKVAEVANY
ncbi:MAG: B12-binding domain-containing radical SAM protein [Magnetococcales bacterium]|nr:B12-binding domain-containing radical SAM protein [Magnetococcales bacterium]